jgi:threonine dehydrogenase-like Zn-dependent dehydrogenase
MTKMRAVQVPQAKGPFEIVEREIPEPTPGSVRIKVQACGSQGSEWELGGMEVTAGTVIRVRVEIFLPARLPPWYPA